MVPPGPGSIIWGSGGPWDYYLGVSWGKKGSPQFPLNIVLGAALDAALELKQVQR